MDVVSMHMSGVRNTVASCGTSLTVEQIRLIKRYTRNVTVLYDGDKAGAIAGYLSAEPNASITNCTVENCTVQGYRDIGGLVGYVNNVNGGTGAAVTGNTVKDSTISNDRSNNYKNYTTDAQYDVHEIIGEMVTGVVNSDNTATNVTIEIPAPTFTRALPEAVTTIGNDAETQLDASDLFQTENEEKDIDVSKVEIKVEEETPAATPKKKLMANG